MRRLLPIYVALVVTAPPGVSHGKPVTRILELRPDDPQIVRSVARQVAVDPTSVATVERLPAGELLITPKASGRALLFLLNDGRLDAIRLRVRAQGEPLPEVKASDPQLAAAKKACPELKVERGSEPLLMAKVSPGACYRAVSALLDSDEWLVGDVRLELSPEVLQQQLEVMRSALAALLPAGTAVSLAYVGAELRMRGRLTEAQKEALLPALYANTLGRVLLDDQTEVLPAPADGGHPAPPEPAP